MKWLLWLLGGLLLLILLVGGLAAAAVAFGWIKAPTVGEPKSRWGTVTSEETQVITSVAVENPNPVGIRLGNTRIEAKVLMNDVQIGQGTSGGVRLPRGRSTTELVTRISHRKIPEWWVSHIARQEKTDARIETVGVVSLLGRRITVSGPKITRMVQTDLLRNASSNQPEALTVGPFTFTVKARQFRWGAVSPQQSEIDGRFIVTHNAPAPVTISRITFLVTMNGVTTGQGASTQPVVLPPSQDTPVPVKLVTDNAKLLEWWPTHIRAGERTQYRIDVDATLEATLPLVGRQQFPVRLLGFTDQFQTNLLGA